MATRQKKLSPKQSIHDKKEIDTSKGREYIKQGKVKILKK